MGWRDVYAWFYAWPDLIRYDRTVVLYMAGLVGSVGLGIAVIIGAVKR